MADKKLVRSANKKIAGVCGGLAEFLGLDASIVRVVWLLCVLLGGFGLLAYLIMWLVMPAQKSSFELKNMYRKGLEKIQAFFDIYTLFKHAKLYPIFSNSTSNIRVEKPGIGPLVLEP